MGRPVFSNNLSFNLFVVRDILSSLECRLGKLLMLYLNRAFNPVGLRFNHRQKDHFTFKMDQRQLEKRTHQLLQPLFITQNKSLGSVCAGFIYYDSR